MDIAKELERYKQEIINVLEIFKDTYKSYNLIHLWKQDKISRVNTLKYEKETLEFSLHGSGVTLERNDIIISFEIIDDKIISNAFNFKMYLETKFNTFVNDKDISKILNKDIVIDLSPDGA